MRKIATKVLKQINKANDRKVIDLNEYRQQKGLPNRTNWWKSSSLNAWVRPLPMLRPLWKDIKPHFLRQNH
jgi:hypothetical protein